MPVEDVMKNPNINVTETVSQPVNTPAVTAPATVNVKDATSNDTLATGNAQGSNTTNTKRNVEQLYQTIQGICSANGIDFNKVKQMKLLSSVSGKNEEYLLNAEQAEINKLAKLIEETIAAMKEDRVELTAENLEKLARGYQIQLNCGWSSIASFRKSNKNSHESVIARLNRFFNCDFEKLSTEQKAEKLDAYFNRYFNGADSNDAIRTKQLTDFSKLLFNSTPEERLILKDAIEFLCAKNRYTGFDSILKSFDTDAERTEFANQVTNEDIHRMATRVDRMGEVPSEEDMTAITASALQWKDEEHVSEYHETAQENRNEFFTEENIAKIDAIKEKIEKGEDLTEEEQALYQEYKFHTADTAGEIVGVANNEVVSEGFKTEMLETLNTDAYENPNYKEVMEQVNNYIKEHPETLTMPVDKFIEKMNEITNGNFEKVVSGSSEPLTAPTVKERTNVSNITSTPTTVVDIEASRARINAIQYEIAQNNIVEPNLATTLDIPEQDNSKSGTPLKRAIYCLRNLKDKSVNYAQELAQLVTQIPRTVQVMLLQFTSGEGFNIILDNADKNAILDTKGKGLSTYQSQLLTERIEEIQEQEEVPTLGGNIS